MSDSILPTQILPKNRSKFARLVVFLTQLMRFRFLFRERGTDDDICQEESTRHSDKIKSMDAPRQMSLEFQASGAISKLIPIANSELDVDLLRELADVNDRISGGFSFIDYDGMSFQVNGKLTQEIRKKLEFALTSELGHIIHISESQESRR